MCINEEFNNSQREIILRNPPEKSILQSRFEFPAQSYSIWSSFLESLIHAKEALVNIDFKNKL